MLNLDSNGESKLSLIYDILIYINGVFFFCYSFHQWNFFDVVLFQIRHKISVFVDSLL